jgi:thioredoxin 1
MDTEKSMSALVSEVNDTNFEAEVLNSQIPVLVDFWGPWCGPCKALGVVIEQIADKYQGKAKFVKVNADENLGIAGKYNVRGLPTILVIKDGAVKHQVVGSTSKDNITKMLDSCM